MNEFLPGQDGLAVDLFEKLHLSGRDIDRFYTAFTDMDSDNRLVCCCAYIFIS